MSKVLPYIIGAAEIVGGAILMSNPATAPLGMQLVFAGTVTIVGGAANALLNEKPGRQAQEARLKIGETPRKALFGKVSQPGALKDGNWDDRF